MTLRKTRLGTACNFPQLALLIKKRDGKKRETKPSKQNLGQRAGTYVKVRDVLLLKAYVSLYITRTCDLRNYILFSTAGTFLPFDFLSTVSVSCIILKKDLEEIHLYDAMRVARTSPTIVKSCRVDIFLIYNNIL